MRSAHKTILADFNKQAVAIGGRYAVAFVYAQYEPKDEQPYQCCYRLPSSEGVEQAPAAASALLALAQLEDCLWQAYHSNQVLSLH